MLEEMSNVPEMYGHEVFPELYYEDTPARLARLSRMLAPVPSKKRMLEKNMSLIDRAISNGDQEEFFRLCKERYHIECEWNR